MSRHAIDATRQRAAIIARGSPAMRRATRAIQGGLAGLIDDTRPIQGHYTQHRLAIIGGNIVIVCDLTGEAPSECMSRLRVPPALRYHIHRVKGPAGDKLRALQAKKKSYAKPAEDPAVAAAKSAANERQYKIAEAAMDAGMDAAKVWAYAEAEDARRQAALADTAIDVTSAMGLTDDVAPATDGLGIEMEAADENEQGLPPQGAA